MMMIQEESGGGLNKDLITEILLRLPPKSVGRLRCVAKQWLSLTSNPHFIRNHRSSSGFFLRNPYDAEFFSLTGGDDAGQDPDPSLFFLAFDGYPAVLLDSCNGLILCRLPEIFSASSNKYSSVFLSVCNPMTREHDVVEFSGEPEDMLRSSTISFALAFDPSSSPNFRIIALVTAFLGPPCHNVYKYSSESRSWKLLQKVDLGHWNFSIYWKGMLFLWRESEYGPQSYFPDVKQRGRERPQIRVLDVEEERIRNPPLLPESVGGMKLWYMGESRGRLYVIRDQINHCFEILEMTSESSGWRLIRTAHLHSLCYIKKMRKASDYHGLIAGFIRGDNGDRLLLRVPGQIVSYHLQDKKFMPVCAVQTKYSHLIFPLTHTLFSL